MSVPHFTSPGGRSFRVSPFKCIFGDFFKYTIHCTLISITKNIGLANEEARKHGLIYGGQRIRDHGGGKLLDPLTLTLLSYL